MFQVQDTDTRAPNTVGGNVKVAQENRNSRKPAKENPIQHMSMGKWRAKTLHRNQLTRFVGCLATMLSSTPDRRACDLSRL